MESRGLPRVTARTRRGATLLWALFFIFSIGLQYMSALAPASVEAASLTAPIPGLMPTSPQANRFRDRRRPAERQREYESGRSRHHRHVAACELGRP